ncbi:MAG: DUF3108 domain-containing protein [candidate division WOR-3 bacterium]
MIILFIFVSFLEPGEVLEYEAKYGFLKVGTMRLMVVAETVYNQDTVYHLISDVVSNPRYRLFFWLKDRLESYARKKDLLPVFTVKDIEERNYKKKSTVEFDHKNLRARYSDGSEFKILPESYDLLGFYYKLRELKIEIGDTISINNHTDKKNYTIKVTALQHAKVKTDFGRWDCTLYEPQTREKGIFGKDGKLLVWIADDSTRIPVLIKSRMSLGSLVFNLVAYNR